jgi:hypothetical protein
MPSFVFSGSQAQQTGIGLAQQGSMKAPQTIEVTKDDKRVLREFVDTLEHLIAVCDAGVERLRAGSHEAA